MIAVANDEVVAMGIDFPFWITASARSTAVACRGEHPARTQGAHSEGIVAPTKMAPCGAQWHAGASASVPAAYRSVGTVALAK